MWINNKHCILLVLTLQFDYFLELREDWYTGLIAFLTRQNIINLKLKQIVKNKF
jgi:hypothetical protein